MPVSVDARLCGRALHLPPISARILYARDSLSLGLSHDGPAGAGDPDGFHGCHGLRGVVSLPKDAVGVVDRVCHVVVVVGEDDDADEGAGGHDGFVDGFDPRRPGIDVADPFVPGDRGADGVAGSYEAGNQDFGLDARVLLSFHAEFAGAEQVHASDRNADDFVDKRLTVLGDCCFEGDQFVFEDGIASRAPESKK
jgi:hypothetical protein